MRFWDKSALVPWLVEEARSPAVRDWLKEDPVIVTGALTVLELSAAIEARAREGAIDRAQRAQLLRDLGEVSADWHEVSDFLSIRKKAVSLLARHALAATDAAQLAAAVLVSDAQGHAITFVTFDERLAEAAEREGLVVLGV